MATVGWQVGLHKSLTGLFSNSFYQSSTFCQHGRWRITVKPHLSDKIFKSLVFLALFSHHSRWAKWSLKSQTFRANLQMLGFSSFFWCHQTRMGQEVWNRRPFIGKSCKPLRLSIIVNPGCHNGPKFIETCFEVLETSFQANICTNCPNIFTNSLKICTNYPKICTNFPKILTNFPKIF